MTYEPSPRMPSAAEKRVVAKIERAMRYIEKCYRTNPSLNTVAARVGVSPYYLLRCFSAHFGRSPKRAVDLLRAAEAKKLLLRGLTCATVSRKIGCKHQSHFTLWFKTMVGDSPKRWVGKQCRSAPAGVSL